MNVVKEDMQRAGVTEGDASNRHGEVEADHPLWWPKGKKQGKVDLLLSWCQLLSSTISMVAEFKDTAQITENSLPQCKYIVMISFKVAAE